MSAPAPELADIRQAFTAWQRTASLSREAHHAATRVCNSLRMCAEYPDRELFVRMLEQDVAQLNAALGEGR